MRVVLSTWGRFHSFHLARRLLRDNWLVALFTTFPKFALKREQIPEQFIFSNAWIHTFLMAKGRFGFSWPTIDMYLATFMDWSQQRFIGRNIPKCDALFALSGSGLTGGRIVQARGGVWLCERTSSHISAQLRLVSEEHRRWRSSPPPASMWAVRKELTEYEEANAIIVPSSFVKRTFLDEGVPDAKLHLAPLGTSLAHFQKVGDPLPDEFRVLFVGQVSLRKGVPYLLKAFDSFVHPRKKLLIVGSIAPGLKPLLDKLPQENVEYVNHVRHFELKHIFSKSHVFVLPSIEEGLANVMGEALACGCPVIASENTGARDLFTDGVEGFIVPIRDEVAICDRLERLAQDAALRERMGADAIKRVMLRGGWDEYTARVKDIIMQLVRT
jgi:glycosyltransferase involved in cell wall biosynthesis